MAPNYPSLEPDELYTRDFLVRVPNAFPQDTRHNEGHRHSALLPLAVSCLSMAAMVIYHLTVNHILAWDLKTWILVLFTGGVSFALAHIFVTTIFSEE